MGRWSLEGKVALVTGAARGIGAETAAELARRGARVALVGLEPEELERQAAMLGDDRAIAITADVCDQAGLEAAAAQTVRRFGSIDVVVANAGIASYGPVASIDPAAFAKTVEINLVGVYRTAAATISHLRSSKGYFLAVSSMTSFTPFAGSSAYVSSKAGVEAFALAFGSEERANGVRVGSAHPAWIETDLVADLERDLDVFGRMRRWMLPPMNATLSPSQCAAQIADGIERRRIRVYVPRTIGLLYWLRPLLWSAAMRWVGARPARRWMGELEQEMRDLGRSTSERTQKLDLEPDARAEGQPRAASRATQ